MLVIDDNDSNDLDSAFGAVHYKNLTFGTWSLDVTGSTYDVIGNSTDNPVLNLSYDILSSSWGSLLVGVIATGYNYVPDPNPDLFNPVPVTFQVAGTTNGTAEYNYWVDPAGGFGGGFNYGNWIGGNYFEVPPYADTQTLLADEYGYVGFDSTGLTPYSLSTTALFNVPEPASLSLLIFGLLGLLGLRRFAA